MTGLKIQFEMARLMQEYESIQLAISHVLGGEVKDVDPTRRGLPSLEGATEITNMAGLMSAFHTIGGKIGN